MKKPKKNKSKEKVLEKTEPPAVKPAEESSSDRLAEQIKEKAADLVYISETDAEITPFVGKTAADSDAREILAQTEKAADAPIEEKDFASFFARLTEIQDWFGDEEKENAQKFVGLREVLENNLRDLKVFKIGKVELDVYVVGLDDKNTLLGIKTKAVET